MYIPQNTIHLKAVQILTFFTFTGMPAIKLCCFPDTLRFKIFICFYSSIKFIKKKQ